MLLYLWVILYMCMYASAHLKQTCVHQHTGECVFVYVCMYPGVTWNYECVHTYLCLCVSVRLQHLSNCWSIRGSALWSSGCAGPQHSLRRVVSHHARLITDAASLLAAWQALPSATMLHASDNFISPIQPSKSPLLYSTLPATAN